MRWTRGKIPARAGTTTHSGSFASHQAEDPRAGGDDAFIAESSTMVLGRSPRGRGRPPPRTPSPPPSGKIPARAGTTASVIGGLFGTAEDPRAGGDDARRSAGSAGHKGRSPRGRGRLRGIRGIRGTRGKIPARAGTTSPSPGSASWLSEDPRAGGDDSARPSPNRQPRGRSPRGRGRLREPRGSHRPPGKIPARAGTTSDRKPIPRRRREDPRAGGDDFVEHDRLRLYPADERKIPARAGTTWVRTRPRWGRREDPRAGGDDDGVGAVPA